MSVTHAWTLSGEVITNFVNDNTPLPPLKEDMHGVPAGQENTYVSADEYNALWKAIGDLRGAVQLLQSQVADLQSTV